MNTSKSIRRDLTIAGLMLLTAGLGYWFLQRGFYVDRLKVKGAKFFENIEGDVIHIKMTGPKFRDQDLKYMSTISELRAVDLSGSSITEKGLSYLGDCQKLEQLNLSGMQLTEEGMRHVSNIPNLEELLIQDVSLTYEEFIALRKQLPKVKFDANANRMLGWDETSLMEAVLIKETGAVMLWTNTRRGSNVPSDSVITVENLKSISGKEFVTSIGIRAISLTAEAALELESFPNLTRLSFSCRINHQIMQMISGFSKLEGLSISPPAKANSDSQMYEITCADIEALSQLKKLRHISFISFNAKPGAFAALQLLPNLNSIQLSHNNLVDADILFLLDLRDLKRVDMSGNQLTKASLETLKKLPDLLSVDLKDNPIDPEILEAFEKFLRDRRTVQEDSDSPL